MVKSKMVIKMDTATIREFPFLKPQDEHILPLVCKQQHVDLTVKVQTL